MFALIDQFGRVSDVASAEFPVAAPMKWVDISAVTPTPARDWTYSNGAFAAPVLAEMMLTDQAKAALTASDITILRCFEHGVAVPAEWQAYRASLRAIIAGTGTTLPARPSWPAGT